uniref:Uncharacterized protein n=1 Tax=Panagrolaimus sp. PS1159 TaxID=55785 RepID=A0AC35FSV4_9BILA
MVNQSNQRARIPYREFGNSRRTPAPQFRNDHGRTRVELEQPPPQRQQKQREQPSRSRSSNTENRNTRQEHQPTPRSRSRSAVNRQSRSRSRQPRRSRSTRKPRDLKIFRNKIKITSNLDNVMNMMCIDMNQDNIPFVPNIFCHHEVINFEDQNESFNQIAALVEHLSK